MIVQVTRIFPTGFKQKLNQLMLSRLTEDSKTTHRCIQQSAPTIQCPYTDITFRADRADSLLKTSWLVLPLLAALTTEYVTTNMVVEHLAA